MTELEFKILSVIRSAGNPQWSAVANLLKADYPLTTINSAIELLMEHKKLIRNTTPAQTQQLCRIRLSNLGEMVLLTEEEKRRKESEMVSQMRNQNAQQEEQQRFENKIAIANLLIPFITFLIGILLEHYTGIIAMLTSIFG